MVDLKALNDERDAEFVSKAGRALCEELRPKLEGLLAVAAVADCQVITISGHTVVYVFLPVTGVSQSDSPHKFTPAKRMSTARNKVFISYRRDDSLDATGRIYDRLIREYGENAVFRDLDAKPFGIDFRSHIDHRFSDCQICFVVIGPKWLEIKDKTGARRIDDPRDYVRVEIETALARNLRVVPLLVGGAPIPSEGELPESLRPLTYRAGTHIRPDPDFHRDVDRLIAGL